MMKRYRGIGWYVVEPHNPQAQPFARTVEVEATGVSDAFDKVSAALNALKQSGEFMNWYIQEVPRA